MASPKIKVTMDPLGMDTKPSSQPHCSIMSEKCKQEQKVDQKKKPNKQQTPFPSNPPKSHRWEHNIIQIHNNVLWDLQYSTKYS